MPASIRSLQFDSTDYGQQLNDKLTKPFFTWFCSTWSPWSTVELPKRILLSVESSTASQRLVRRDEYVMFNCSIWWSWKGTQGHSNLMSNTPSPLDRYLIIASQNLLLLGKSTIIFRPPGTAHFGNCLLWQSTRNVSMCPTVTLK